MSATSKLALTGHCTACGRRVPLTEATELRTPLFPNSETDRREVTVVFCLECVWESQNGR